MTQESLDDLLDRLVSEYSDRVARGDERREDLLALVPPAHRASLERCFRMIDTGRAQPAHAAPPLGPGVVLGQFRIVALIGRGGMASVYRAEQLELGREVALKVLRAGLALEPKHVERFHREALAIARLQHPNIVQVHTVGEAAGHHYIAMEFVDGPTLAQVFARLPAHRPWTARDLAAAAGIASLGDHALPFERALARLMTKVVEALGVAHELGIVHRDLKPQNILLHRDGRPTIADFGLAKGDTDLSLSLTGEPLGTPYYMAPEQVQQADAGLDARCDLYSLGVTLYEGLTGERPFAGATALAVFDAIRRGTPAPLRQLSPDCSRDAEAVVQKAMARQRDDRYASAAELADDLRALADRRPTRAARDAGGAMRRSIRTLGLILSGQPFEYRSMRTLLGLPLVHVHTGRRQAHEPRRTARGWIAIGSIAVGGVAIGQFAVGLLALGVLALGLVGVGGALGIGALGLGGNGLGLLASGGVAIGHTALGGLAIGYYALGGKAIAVHAISGMGVDPVAVAWFERVLPEWVQTMLSLPALAN